MKIFLDYFKSAKAYDFYVSMAYTNYVNFYKNADESVKKKLLPGFDEFLKIYNNPKTSDVGHKLLGYVAQPWLGKTYTPENQKLLLGMLQDATASIKLKMDERVNLYGSYNQLYTLAPAEMTKAYKKPLKLQFELKESIKLSLKDPSIPPPELQIMVHSFQAMELDFTRGLNHTLSILSHDLPDESKKFISEFLGTQIDEYTHDMMFRSFEAPHQRRMLLTIKAYTEKMIALGEKESAKKGIDLYKKAYKLARPSVVASMPKPDELRSWTKRSGHSSCTLVEMLANLQ